MMHAACVVVVLWLVVLWLVMLDFVGYSIRLVVLVSNVCCMWLVSAG